MQAGFNASCRAGAAPVAVVGSNGGVGEQRFLRIAAITDSLAVPHHS